MKKNLLTILNEKKIFKLILGLGNACSDDITHNVKIYASAGADMFDINASEASIQAMYKGIELAGKNKDDFWVSISIGVSGDTHVQKAEILEDKCKKCQACIKKCPQNAIVSDGGYPRVINEKCIGCKKCSKCSAIKFFDHENDFDEALRLAEKYNIDCIELHLSSKKLPYDKIKNFVKRVSVPVSFCIDRKYYSNEKIKKLINKFEKWIGSKNFIIQADGVPMSGGEDTFDSTLQSVAMAHLVQDFGTYIFLSGGTNSKTAQLAKLCSIRYNGVGIGSYARKIIIAKNDEDAVKIAKNLVDECKI